MPSATLLDMPAEIKRQIMSSCDSFKDMASLPQTSPLFNSLWRANTASISRDFFANSASYPKEAQDLAAVHVEIFNSRLDGPSYSRIEWALKLNQQLVIYRKIAIAATKKFLALLRKLMLELRPSKTPGIWTLAPIEHTYYRLWHLCLAEHDDTKGREEFFPPDARSVYALQRRIPAHLGPCRKCAQRPALRTPCAVSDDRKAQFP